MSIVLPVAEPVWSPIASAVDAPMWTRTIDQQIATLFANNEQGVWYDIDPAYCYQDAAGTVPAVVGQPVGLVLDRSGRGNHASQTTATSRPILRQNATTGAYYLEFDGSNDWLVTNAIDFTATDKMTVWAGVRKLSDVAGIVYELSQNWINNAGTFYLSAGLDTTQGYRAASRGVNGAVASQTSFFEVSGTDTSVVSVTHNISGDSTVLRRNGIASPAGTGDKGAGNFGNYPLYIGRRGGTTLPFKGHLYGLLVRGAQSTEAQIALVERYLAKKTGVTLA